MFWGVSKSGSPALRPITSRPCAFSSAARVLMAIEIEDREGNKAPPSLATTEMKPKDCKLFQDIKQKMFFRFHVFHAQGLNATNAQVTCRGFRV